MPVNRKLSKPTFPIYAYIILAFPARVRIRTRYRSLYLFFYMYLLNYTFLYYFWFTWFTFSEIPLFIGVFR